MEVSDGRVIDRGTALGLLRLLGAIGNALAEPDAAEQAAVTGAVAAGVEAALAPLAGMAATAQRREPPPPPPPAPAPPPDPEPEP